LPNTAWFIRNLLLPSFWTAAQISTVHTVLPWEAFLIFGIHKSNPNRTYSTSLRSFPHFWDLQIRSQPYIQDFLEKLSSSLGSIYKSNPNRTYRTSLRSFHHLLGSIYRRSDLNRRYKTFLRSFHHLWDRFTNQISTIQVWLPLKFSSTLKLIVEITFMYFTMLIWNHFHVFHKTNVEITFMYFTRLRLKSLSCISQKKKNQCWNHFHVFHKTIVEITFMYFTMLIWNHFHVFHKTIVEITFIYFTMHCWNHFHVFHKKNQCWNHFHIFHKTIVEITFMYFTKKSILKSLSCISQD